MASGVIGEPGMPRVLIVAFRFPPHGGGGVHRITAFTRYLPRFGWRPHVLTGPIGDYRSLQDLTLLATVPEDVPVTRTGYTDTGRVFSALGRLHLASALRAVTPSLPSMSAGWISHGFREGMRLLERERVDAIWSSSYPISSHIVALLLKRRTGLPWIADYRDEWSMRGMIRWSTPLHRRLAIAIDRRITREADRVVTTSPVHTASFACRFPVEDPDRYHTITNGYDPEDFEDGAERTVERPDGFLIAHVGSVFAWRGADPVLTAVERLIDSGRVPADRLRLRFIGNTKDPGHARLQERGIVASVGYVPHDRAVAWMKAADVLLLNNTEATNIPGKTFEYLAARRPILAVVPPGPAAEIVRETGPGPVVDYADVDGIARAIERLYREWSDWRGRGGATDGEIGRYSRLETTRRLAGLLDGLVAPGAGAPVYVVSGLPRSGTSMAMRMLEAGGLPVLTDGLREADPDNPAGYYELERVKALRRGDAGWVADARGRAVKVVSELLRHLPDGHEYRVLFMRRDLAEILASQRRMLERRGTDDDRDDERMAELYRRHLRAVEAWIAGRSNVRVLDVGYADVLADPAREAGRIREFLEVPLDIERMSAVVDPALYRRRASDKPKVVGN